MKKLIFITLTAFTSMAMEAEVKLPGYLTDNMVLQQNTAINIPGVTTPGAKVTVTPSWGKAVKAVADADGKFIVTLDTPNAGGPFSITFDDGDTLTLNNLLSGEVWICSGQSNMEMPIAGWGKVMDYEKEIALANNPDIRLLQVRKNISTTPLETVDFNGDGWLECTSQTVPEFSACAYFFARELADKLGVPVGVIDTTWGGTAAEAWTPQEYLQEVPGFENELADLDEAAGDVEKMQRLNADRYNAWKGLLSQDRQDFATDVNHKGEAGWNMMPVPGNWETTVLPGFDGIIYLQREIEIPAAWTGKKLTIHFPAVDDDDVTYFNGVEVGRGSGYNVEREYTVPAELVKEGTALLTVVVTDTGGEGGIYGNPTKLYAECDGQRISLNGDWAYMISSDFTKYPPAPVTVDSPNYPTVLYNAMINPLRNLPVKGAIWYQGCANVGRADQYAILFPQMVKSWRDKLNNPDMPFYFVQLAGYLAPVSCQPDSEWAALRNSQLSVLELPHTGVAAAIDLGNPGDIHPKNKQEVARRLSLLARNKTYGQDVACEAPHCVATKVSGDKITLTFNEPVHSTSSALLGFIAGDKEGNWAHATGTISADGKTVTLSAPGIAKPVAVRYDWADYPMGNLYGEADLPVVPFATDK